MVLLIFAAWENSRNANVVMAPRLGAIHRAFATQVGKGKSGAAITTIVGPQQGEQCLIAVDRQQPAIAQHKTTGCEIKSEATHFTQVVFHDVIPVNFNTAPQNVANPKSREPQYFLRRFCVKAARAKAFYLGPARIVKQNLSGRKKAPVLQGPRSIWRKASTACHLHPVNEQRAHGFGAVVVGIGSHGFNAFEHVAQVAGDGDFMHRKGDLAVLYPKAAGAA